jgi:hypothetical protein
MAKLIESHKDRKPLLSAFQQIEETFILASMIREAMKELFGAGNCLGILEKRITSPSIVSTLRAKETYYSGYKTEINLKFLDMIRNEFSFHLKKSIYDGNITDGDAKDDMHICVSLDRTNRSIVYVPPVKAALFKVDKFVKEHGIPEDPETYLFDCVHDETIGLFQFVNSFVADVIKGNAYKKKENHWE